MILLFLNHYLCCFYFSSITNNAAINIFMNEDGVFFFQIISLGKTRKRTIPESKGITIWYDSCYIYDCYLECDTSLIFWWEPLNWVNT